MDLHHRQAVARLDLGDAGRGFVAMQLQHVQRHGLGDGVQRRIVRVHHQCHLAQPLGGRHGQQPGLGRRHETRRLRKEVEPGVSGTCLRDGSQILGRPQPADLDPDLLHQRFSSSASTSSCGGTELESFSTASSRSRRVTSRDFWLAVTR